MLLWTIQHEAAFGTMMKSGVLRADPHYLPCEDAFRRGYDWMVNQMRLRIGEPPEEGLYPIWAWYQWEGKHQRRDLRSSGYAKRGTSMVQIAFEVDANECLLSDFDEWHAVLNHSYIADSEKDYDEFYAQSNPHQEEDIIASWEKIFDLQRQDADWNGDLDNGSVQATLWEIKPSQILKVEHFHAK